MRRKINKIMVNVLALMGFVLILAIVSKSEALEPKLLWEKKLPFEISDIKMAVESGDVILSSGEASQIILYDKNGNKRFQWGPRIDRAPGYVDISSGGSVIVYVTSWTEDYTERKKIDIEKSGWNTRIHYSTKKGKELWNKKREGGVPYLSPDGTLVAIGVPPGYGGELTVLDSSGKTLWKWGGEYTSVLDIQFSPDGNYLVVSTGGIHLFNKTGEHLWEKGGGENLSVSQNAGIISTQYEEGGEIYDKQGNILLKKRAIISSDGSKAAIIEPDKTTLIKLPTLEMLKEYPIIAYVSYMEPIPINVSFSSDGKYLIIVGSKPLSENNLFVIDTTTNVVWEAKVTGKITHLFLTSDGKYMLAVINSNQLRYYQVY